MTDCDKTNEQLIEALAEMGRRIAALEARQAACERTAKDGREREALLRFMLENIPVDFWARDSQGRCFLQSRVSRELWGSLTGTLGSEHVPAQTAAQWKANSQRVLRGEVVREEVQLVTADGRRRDFFNIVAPIVDGDSVQGCFGINLDVTERKQMEQALRESEERFRLAFRDGPVPMIIGDHEGRILQANLAMAHLSGYAEEEFAGRHVSEFSHPDDRELSAPLLEQLLRGEIPGFTLEKRYIRKDGQIVWAKATTAAAHDPQGKTTYALAVLEDITARKRAEAALCESEVKYRRLLENMPDFVVVVDLEARIRFANRPAPGTSVPELIGSTGFDHIVPEHRPACRAAFEKALATGEVQSVELLDVYGTWFSSRVVPLAIGEAGAGAMIISADVTQRRNAEAATQEKQRLLQQSLEVYEQHQQLAAYEIHDGVAQPLAGALMNLEASLRLLDAQRLDAARDGLAKTRQLLQDTIDQARRLMNGLRPPILDELGILPAIDQLVYEHQSAGAMAVDYTQSVGFTRLAPPLETALFRIVQEGLANAQRHSRSGKVRLALVQQGDRVRVEIEDGGVGFDPARVEQGRFGLKGIRERAQLFGGSATIQSAPGRGTRITVELPLVEAVPKATWDAT